MRQEPTAGLRVRVSLCLAAAALSCGRAGIEDLGLISTPAGDGDGGPPRGDGPRTDGPLRGDGPIGVDGPIVDPKDRDGGPPDTGPVVACATPEDCFRAAGGPPVCDRGRWECIFGQCVAACDPPPARCRNDCDCRFREACLGDRCQPAGRENLCCGNPNCAPGSFCVLPNGQSSTCGGGPPPPDAGPLADAGPRPDSGPLPGDTPVGAACIGDMDGCGDAGFCIDESNGFPGGYCSQECGPNGTPCPVGAVCRGVGNGEAICLDACVRSDVPECRPGYNCIQLGLGLQRVCWPIPPSSTNPNGAMIGSACSFDEECRTGLSCLSFEGWPDGYCTLQYCDPVTNPCPGGSLCYAFPGLFSLCLAECPSGGSRSTCRQGYYCLGPTGLPGVCIGN